MQEAIPGAAERFQQLKILANQCFFLRSRPAFELAFTGGSLIGLEWTFTVDQSWRFMVKRVLAAQAEAMLAEAFLEVAPLSDVEGTVDGLQDVDPSKAENRCAAGCGWE